MGRTRWADCYTPCQDNSRQVAVDATPTYLASDAAPALIASWYGSLATNLRFVVVMREPLDRMQSAYYYNKIHYATKASAQPTFQLYVENEILVHSHFAPAD